MSSKHEEAKRIIDATTESYQAISDLKKKINAEVAEATAAIEAKYAEELKQLTESHDFYVAMLKG